MAATDRARYTRAEYIAFERASNARHEFLDGAIHAMAGGSREHAAIAGNVIAALHLALRDRPCAVHTSDLRIRVVDTGLETYPDASVVCGRAEIDPDDPHVVLDPIVLVEVTRPSTEAYDRGDKLRHYEQIPSLREVASGLPSRSVGSRALDGRGAPVGKPRLSSTSVSIAGSVTEPSTKGGRRTACRSGRRPRRCAAAAWPGRREASRRTEAADQAVPMLDGQEVGGEHDDRSRATRGLGSVGPMVRGCSDTQAPRGAPLAPP